MDAEESHRQPAIEAIYRCVAKKWNKELKPVLYNTYQCYLTRTEGILRQDFEHAEKNDYIFAAKVVRGAYLASEKQRGNIVHASKMATDLSYDKITMSLLKNIFVPIAKCIWLVVACCYIWQVVRLI